MKTQLDNIEYAASGMQDYKGISSVNIELSRENFELLEKEIKDEYDLDMTCETLVNEYNNFFSKGESSYFNEYTVVLHNVTFRFYVKD